MAPNEIGWEELMDRLVIDPGTPVVLIYLGSLPLKYSGQHISTVHIAQTTTEIWAIPNQNTKFQVSTANNYV